MTINLVAPTPHRAFVGVIAGLAGMAVGIAGIESQTQRVAPTSTTWLWDDARPMKALGRIDFAVGAATAGISLVQLIVQSHGTAQAEPPRFSVAPAISSDGAALAAAFAF
jgi:hypothetical protein